MNIIQSIANAFKEFFDQFYRRKTASSKGIGFAD